MKVILLALVAHLVLLTGPPYAVAGVSVLFSWRVMLFLVLTSAWMMCEGALTLDRVRVILVPHPGRQSAKASALAILAIFWVSLVDGAGWGAKGLAASVAAGTILMFGGAALRCVSIGTLDRFFLDDVVLLPGHQLVTHGVFAWMRHPSEAGNVLLGFGAALVLASPSGLVAGAVLLLPAAVLRMVSEDRLLKREYSEVYDRYAANVGWFAPRGSRWRRVIVDSWLRM